LLVLRTQARPRELAAGTMITGGACREKKVAERSGERECRDMHMDRDVLLQE
jgi:hypothetical protein